MTNHGPPFMFMIIMLAILALVIGIASPISLDALRPPVDLTEIDQHFSLQGAYLDDTVRSAIINPATSHGRRCRGHAPMRGGVSPHAVVGGQTFDHNF